MVDKVKRDNTKLEYTAEELIAHRLQLFDLLVAKPKFDRNGADLLAFMELADGVKFCRIQCKGRTVKKSNSHVEIPKGYVTPSFVLFVFVDDGSFDSNNLYCFIASDIQAWSKNDKYYTLGIKQKTFKEDLSYYRFDKYRVGLIKTVIEQAEVHGEFRKAVYGHIRPVVGTSEALPIKGFTEQP